VSSTVIEHRSDVSARAFPAMGSDAEVIVVGGRAGLIDEATDEIDRLERLWSRFRPDSEVSEINRRAGETVAVDRATSLLAQRSIAAWRITGGGFDPTVLGAMLRAGYGAPFDPDRRERTADPSDLVVGSSDIVVDRDRSTVTIPAGVGFDPGGIGKGLAADIVATLLMDRGAEGACVNIGGDLRVEGVGPVDESWTIAIDHPHRAAPLALVTLSGGAVATSTTLKRRWTVAGEQRHHLIDPATGRPTDSDVELMTVIAGQAWLAEALATASLLRGRHRVFDLLDHTNPALAALDDGSVVTTDTLDPFLVPLTHPARTHPARTS